MPSISDHDSRVVVWTWLPESAAPIVAGVLDRASDTRWTFTYAQSYLANPASISLYAPELPLIDGAQEPTDGLIMAACLIDATPDAWGQRVLMDHLHTFDDLSTATCMLESGSDRLGAIDFQRNEHDYRPRDTFTGLDELYDAAETVLAGGRLNPALTDALVRAAPIGGAHPKVALRDTDGRAWIAKLSVPGDGHPVIHGEALACELARRCAIEVPNTRVISSKGRDVLLLERFDRDLDGRRRHVVSGLTMLGLDAFLGARYGSYPDLLDVLRAFGRNPHDVGRELFTRIVFNVAIGNNDDHMRNHAAFWDGESLTLTPAFDLTPQVRSTDTSAQAMAIGRDGNRVSQFSTCVNAAADYGLSGKEASEIVDRIVDVISTNWTDVADLAGLSAADRAALWQRSILNRSVFYD